MLEQKKFSVIIPVFNGEAYIEKSVESVINQSIGFKDTEIIIVNDGSTDQTAYIAMHLQRQYPQNITYIYQDNRGVSSARNTGFRYAQGALINFMDCDDFWADTTFENIWKIFLQHDVSYISVYLEYYNISREEHPLSYKFRSKTRIVDLEQGYDNIQLSASSTFFIKEKMGEIKFDERLRYSEDAKYILEFIANNDKKVAYLARNEGTYFYRAHGADEEKSAMQHHKKDLHWYIETITYYHCAYFLGKEELLEYEQFTLMYDLQFRLRKARTDLQILTREEKENYINKLEELLQMISHKIIRNKHIHYLHDIEKERLISSLDKLYDVYEKSLE